MIASVILVQKPLPMRAERLLFADCFAVVRVLCTENLIRVDGAMESPKLAE
jgi:hypothetical protein